MNIIIAGAGSVGYKLAQTLSYKHNVIVLDKDDDTLSLLEKLDIMSIKGDVENPDLYWLLPNEEFDIFIAVTDSDEANILSTLIADDAIKVNKKIIRLKNKYFAKSEIAHKLGVSDSIFPFVQTAKSIQMLLDFPKANNVKEFIYSDFKLISVFVSNADVDGMSVADVIGEKIQVVGIERNKNFFIPSPEDSFEKGDLVYFFGDSKSIKDICVKIENKMPKDINRVTIFGADLLGVEIAKSLLERDVTIKIIEKESSLCKKASEQLQDSVSIINSKFSEHSIYDEEQIEMSDMVISTDKDDEENIIRCLEAKERGVNKVIAINNHMQHYALMHKLGIIAARGPKTQAYHAILEKIVSSSVISEKYYCGGGAAVFSRMIFKESPLVGKKIKPFLEKGVISFILRENNIFPFVEKEILEELDVIFVFLSSNLEERVKKWIYSL